jgi:hypothetical protein
MAYYNLYSNNVVERNGTKIAKYHLAKAISAFIKAKTVMFSVAYPVAFT